MPDEPAHCLFEGSCGENSFATSTAGLQRNQQVEIGGTTDLRSCIEANDRGCVFNIYSGPRDLVYASQLFVDAQGPRGIGSGSLYLAFTDGTGDTYKLSIFSSHRRTHTLAYNSENPAIFKIQWSNDPI